MLSDLDNKIKEGQEKWKQIDELYNELKQKDLSNIRDKSVELLLLLVDYLRPTNPTQEQIDSAAKSIFDLVKSIKK